MKYLLVIGVLVALYQYFNSKSAPEYTSWYEIINKVEEEGATLTEVKYGATLLAKQLCNDESFQSSGGQTLDSCQRSYQKRRKNCDEIVFRDAPETFLIKKEVSTLANRYLLCVGAV